MRLFLIFTIIIFSNSSFANKNINQLLATSDLDCSNEILTKINKGNYKLDISDFSLCNDNSLNNLAIWYLLKNGKKIDFKTAKNFTAEKYYYPNISELHLNSEKLLHKNLSNTEIINFFADKKPSTKLGYQLLKKALLNNNNAEFSDNIPTITTQYFLASSFNFEDHKKDLDEILQYVNKQNLYKKISNLINKRQYKNAKKLFPYISNNYKDYFKTRINLKRNYYRADKFKKLHKKLQKEADLFYDLARFYERKNKDNKITPLIIGLRGEEDQKRWTQIRIRNARYLLKEKRYEIAYRVVKNHNITNNSYELSELEWYAGWISLRFLERPELAIKHFKTMYDSVGYAISLARSSYWLARAYKANNQADKANIWFEIASNYNTTYYGQMAVLELEKEIMISLPKPLEYSIEELQNFLRNDEISKLALYFTANNKIAEAELFFTHAIKNSQDPEKIKLIIALSKYSNNTQLINKISRIAMRFNVNSLANYPFLNNLPASNNIKENALIMSIIKQESGFNVAAVSHAGAVGFMQLMPVTAKDMAKRLKMPYSKLKLKHDAKYNIELGSGYIKLLLNKFDNSNILAIASYNAGPKNIRRWLNENGDPRNEKDPHKIIDWIEKISYQETRNYVQRILESTVIYLHLFRQKSHDFSNPVRKPI
jgi:soluble lytic murein transglycosylase